MTTRSRRGRLSPEDRLREFESDLARVDAILTSACPITLGRPGQPEVSGAVDAVRGGTATLEQYALACHVEIEQYQLACFAIAPLLVAGLTRGFRVSDDRLAIAYPPDATLPAERVATLAFWEWLASASLDERRVFAGASCGRAARVSAAARKDAAVAMLVLGNASAVRFRGLLWALDDDDDKWFVGRATWAPSELATFPAEIFDAVLGLITEGRVRTAVRKGHVKEAKFRLTVAKVVKLMVWQSWAGPETPPAWSESVTISHPPPPTGYKEYPSYPAYTW